MTAEQIGKKLAELKDKDRKLYQEFRKKYFRYVDITDENLDDPIPTDDAGRPQPEKGANRDPNTWKVVPMKDDATLFKVVDGKGINVADLFKTQEGAQAFIDAFKKAPSPEPEPVPIPSPTPPPTTTEPPATTTPTPTQVFPYPAIGTPMQSTQRGPTTRHYASGAPDDKTIEKNVKEIKFDNYQFVCYVQVNTIEHDDTVSLKYGGTHMGSGWFDMTTGFQDGQTCGGYEPEHPTTKKCVIKGTKVGSVLKKNVGFGGIFYKKQNKCELWINMGAGWKKECEGANIGGFNPNSDINEAQLRIDGFEDVPIIQMAVVTEIAAPKA